MLTGLLGPDAKRQRLFRQASHTVLREFYRHAFPGGRTPVSDVTFVALDFETTGLDIGHDHVISIGLVEIQRLHIPLATAWHQIVRIAGDIPGDTAIVHGITDDMVADGMDQQVALSDLISRMQGKVLIAHHAAIELGFLDRFCREHYRQPFYMPTIDTQVLAQRQMRRAHQSYEAGDLRLFNLRKRYALPAYRAHHALSDALSTAELFLALMTDLYPLQDCMLKDLLTVR